MPNRHRFSIAIAFVLLSVVGCVPPDVKPAPVPVPSPAVIANDFQTGSDLKPDVSPPKEANLILNGTVIPVVLKEKRSENSIVYTWIVDSKGESGDPVVVESEKYFFTGDLFSFAATAHEKYDPPINLIRYPLTVGKSWDWAGDVLIGKTRTKAKATITTQSDTQNLATGKISTLLVTVTLTYDEISAPGSRELKFWFKPGEGLIRRELWASSTREPRGSTAEAPEDAVSPEAK